MRDRIVGVLLLSFVFYTLFPDTLDIFYFVAAIFLLLSIIVEIVLRKKVKNFTGLNKLLFGGERSLFSKSSLKEAGIGSIIVYCIVFLWSIAYIIHYVITFLLT